MMLPSGEDGLGRETLKIVLSVLGGGLGALCLFLLLEIMLPGDRHNRDALLLRFHLSAMLAMAMLAGLAIVIYARLSR